MLFCFLMQKSDVNMLLFIADNLACFPYQSQEEPLFIMHHVDITLSVSGSNLLQSFKEVRCFLNSRFMLVNNYKIVVYKKKFFIWCMLENYF